MAKIAIILTLPIEYNTSSMLRCRSIITSLGDLGHKLVCYCPNPDLNSKYYSKKNIDVKGLTINRFKRKPYVSNTNNTETKMTVKTIIKKFALLIFRHFDVFGSSLLYVGERKWISVDLGKENFDILLSFSDPMPTHMIANYCKRKNPNVRYIQQWGDPLASDNIAKINQPFWIKKIMEKALLKPADTVFYVSPFTCEEQKQIFPRYSNKMFFIPTPSLNYKEEIIDKGNITLGYFGSYYSAARNIKPFYEAVKGFNNVNCFIIGDSDVLLESTSNITIVKRISPDELNEYMNKIDVIVCLMNKKGNQIPGKLYHDASSTKDILLIKDGEYGEVIQNFFDKYNHYTFVNNDVDSIDEAIKNYIAKGVPKRMPVKDFMAENIAKQLIEG